MASLSIIIRQDHIDRGVPGVLHASPFVLALEDAGYLLLNETIPGNIPSDVVHIKTKTLMSVSFNIGLFLALDEYDKNMKMFPMTFIMFFY